MAIKYMDDLKKGLISFRRDGASVTLKRVSATMGRRRNREKTLALCLPDPKTLEEQRRTVFQRPRVISILTPLYNTRPDHLRDMIQSVQEQTYPHWELCLADGSTDPEVGEICRELASSDERIVYQKLAENKGISENTNACIQLASGEYYGLLDHDDLLHPSALFEAMRVIEEQQADFLYTDEMVFSKSVENIEYLKLKADFSKYELRSHNYICHFTCFSKELLDHAGLYRSAYDGSQDHDMVLRLSERARKAVHIPKVLYYWRMHEGSVSYDLSAKSYAVDAAIGAVQDQLNRNGVAGTVASALPYQTIYRVQYRINRSPCVTILVHSAADGKSGRTMKFIDQFTTYRNIELLYSHELAPLSQTPSGEYLLFVNAALEQYSSTWVEELLMYAQQKDVGAVGLKCCYQDGRIHNGGITLAPSNNTGLKYWYHGAKENRTEGYEACMRHVRHTTALWEGCLMLRKSLFDQVDGFSGAPVGYEGVHLSLKLRELGLACIWSPFGECWYEMPVDPLAADEEEQGAPAFRKAWKSLLQQRDPYYHPYFKDLAIL